MEKNIDWKNLSFSYTETDYNVRCYYRDGKWGELEISSSDKIGIHIAATSLHYGQEAFEGLKAFKGKDNKIRIFRMDENAKRLNRSAEGILMEPVPEHIFESAVIKAVQLNKHYVPPYESGASLYIRPLLIGTGPKVGVAPADEYLFMVFVTPVGPYFKEGFKLTNVAVFHSFDRAAPNGTGNIKIGGNYAASLKAGKLAKENGYSAVLYLDSKEKKYLDECGPANFYGIINGEYVTPESKSILPSITNMSLFQLAQDLGIKAVRRPIMLEELEKFEEAGQCGTAAVISPVGRVDDQDTGKSYKVTRGEEPGPITKKLYETLRGIQYGDIEDKHGWIKFVD